MKQCYLPVPLMMALFTLVLCLPGSLSAQCLCSDGSPALTEQHSLTTNFSSNSTTTLTVPQFDAATGTLVCVNAKVYLTSVLRMKLENDEVFDIEYQVKYQRKDTLTGPGIDPAVVGSRNKTYGPYSLAASDGNPFAGPDFVAIGPDTIYNMKLYEATTSDVVPYLGSGTVNLNYKTVVNTYAIGSDVYALSVTSQNKLEFQMTYSYCNTAVLALNIKNFQAALEDNNLQVSWTTENETTKNNIYEIEISENGKNFYPIGTKASQPATASSTKYQYQHHFNQSPDGKLYVRIKQVNGTTAKYSVIRTIMVNGEKNGLRIYPNPVVRNINLAFDAPLSGEFAIELANQTGQVVYRKKVWLNNSRTVEVAVSDPPPPGIYYMKARQTGSAKVYSGKLLFKR